jgi:hypothetical protein
MHLGTDIKSTAFPFAMAKSANQGQEGIHFEMAGTQKEGKTRAGP